VTGGDKYSTYRVDCCTKQKPVIGSEVNGISFEIPWSRKLVRYSQTRVSPTSVGPPASESWLFRGSLLSRDHADRTEALRERPVSGFPRGRLEEAVLMVLQSWNGVRFQGVQHLTGM
jgi:hypothetical protein